MRRTATALVFLLLLASVPAHSQSFTDRTIRPGDSIGSVRLGMTLDDVVGVLGRPADAEATEEPLKVYRWNLEGDTAAPGGAPALAIALNGTNAVEQVTTSSPTFTMPGGAGPGISLEAFKREIEARNLWETVQLTASQCLGHCEQGPIAVVYPEGTWYQHLTVGDVPKIIAEHLVGGRPWTKKIME